MGQGMNDKKFLDLCLASASMSQDPSTQVGSVILSPSGLYTIGYNQFPDRIENTSERWNDRDTKIKLVVHAEIVAMVLALAEDFPLHESILYVWAKDVKTGQTWGGPPCIRCTVELIQAGIGEIRVPKPTGIPERWLKDLNYARELILESGVKYTELP